MTRCCDISIDDAVAEAMTGGPMRLTAHSLRAGIAGWRQRGAGADWTECPWWCTTARIV